jgi:hypothetical protein
LDRFLGPEKEGGNGMQGNENYLQRGYGKVSDTFPNNDGKREFNRKCALPDSAQIFFEKR